jgi:DNA-binding transcriptional LysR family regulator
MDMELRQLEHFVAVAEDESFTRAARRLGYVQSALSVSVQSIERELGLRLFDRNTHNTRLTDAGHQLLPAARATLAAAAEVRASAAAVNGMLSGRLAIGIMQAFTFLDVPALLGRFHTEYPGVEISMRPASGGAAELVRLVADGPLDLAFVAAVNVPPGVAMRPLAREELRLAFAPGRGPDRAGTEVATGATREGGGGGEGPVSLVDLAQESFVDFPGGWGVRTVVDQAFSELGLHRRVSIEVADVATLLALVEQGLGVALISPGMTSAARPGLRFREISPSISWDIVVATPANRPPSAAAGAFLELVDSAMAPAGSTPKIWVDTEKGPGL